MGGRGEGKLSLSVYTNADETRTSQSVEVEEHVRPIIRAHGGVFCLFFSSFAWILRLAFFSFFLTINFPPVLFSFFKVDISACTDSTF